MTYFLPSLEFVQIQTLREHFDRFTVFLLSKENFARFEILFTLQQLAFRDVWSILDIFRIDNVAGGGNLLEISSAAMRNTSASLAETPTGIGAELGDGAGSACEW